MPKVFKTIKFSLNLRKDSTGGSIWLTDDRHKLSLGLGAQNFGHWDEIPAKIRKLLKKAKQRKKEF
jgi:hypothetical protein